MAMPPGLRSCRAPLPSPPRHGTSVEPAGARIEPLQLTAAAIEQVDRAAWSHRHVRRRPQAAERTRRLREASGLPTPGAAATARSTRDRRPSESARCRRGLAEPDPAVQQQRRGSCGGAGGGRQTGRSCVLRHLRSTTLIACSVEYSSPCRRSARRCRRAAPRRRARWSAARCWRRRGRRTRAGRRASRRSSRRTASPGRPRPRAADGSSRRSVSIDGVVHLAPGRQSSSDHDVAADLDLLVVRLEHEEFGGQQPPVVEIGADRAQHAVARHRRRGRGSASGTTMTVTTPAACMPGKSG